MKNLVLIFVLFVASIANIGAIPSNGQFVNNQGGRIPIALYTVKLEPPVEVLVIPSKEVVKLGEFADSEIEIDCKSFGGHPVYSPIYVRHDMSLNDIVDSLCESFDVWGIECREGYITKETFSKMFSPFKRK
ncbi:MAG: hypothetical protein K5780_06420 [Alphaproteobacteria bacterium]|nr:hypothetical protein [Alphaproteobacteria bacterium]